MTYQEILSNARTCIGPYCKAGPVCNGKACGSQMPGPGAKGIGDTAIRNYDAWRRIRINLDTISENLTPDTSFDFFGHTMKYPFFAGPVGAVKLHYGDILDDVAYNDILVSACADAGIAAFTGDGTNPAVMKAACSAIAAKDKGKSSGCKFVAMDIDAAGLPFLQNLQPPAGSKTVEELAEVIKTAGKPFIVKGIMTVEAAKKALAAGASGIVVSNHGGRVLDQCPATAEVLYEIAQAVGGSMKIFVDGGIRTGVDVFKALCLGADGVIIARPYVTAVYGGREEGVIVYTEKIGAELVDTMKMCGASSLDVLSEKFLFRPSNPFLA